MAIIVVLIIGIVSSLLVFNISAKFGFHPVLVSALVSLIFALLLKLIGIHNVGEYNISAMFFGGSFVGMSSKNKFNNLQIFIAGIFFSIIYILGLKVFEGFGGLLGASAFVACLCTRFFSKK